MRTRVAIIGGGLAGLCAARALHEAGMEFLLLEARDRLGGRVLSVDAAGRDAGDGFDLGPSWFWPAMQPGLEALVRALRLPHFAQHGEGDILLECTAHGSPQRYRGMRQEPEAMRLVGGMGALVRALEAGLPAEAVRLGARVAGMTLGGAGVTLRVARRGREPRSRGTSNLILAARLRSTERQAAASGVTSGVNRVCLPHRAAPTVQNSAQPDNPDQLGFPSGRGRRSMGPCVTRKRQKARIHRVPAAA
ncbi:FAD-dependent oxidoreductase (plasmid) [Roseomonas sp. OT10]|uniref:FAD-dependent oxidoreductase n=1 Tax=Roseomonas cutis TaxID=2897332 RepID=UPI001E30F7E6|nr:FAD-dependent oxidoreductase [Roseomonas sp. OT10]UFN51626.1 FAD-dependent oxidoreductase [Roseomonas sp. OT10]